MVRCVGFLLKKMSEFHPVLNFFMNRSLGLVSNASGVGYEYLNSSIFFNDCKEFTLITLMAIIKVLGLEEFPLEV